MNKLIAIVGPTASGKSSVAIALAKKCGTEIVSADSAQVYKHLNIGTAKVTEEEKEGVKHHLLDIVGIETEYNIGLFQRDARNVIGEIQGRGKIPILCGGSGLYINSVINKGYDLGEIGGSQKKRDEYLALEKERGEGYLYSLFKERFPRRAEKIHPNDIQRITRGLEMNEDLSDEGENLKWDSPYDLRIFGLLRERETLYRGIDTRVDKMIANGLLQEVRNALAMGYAENGNAMSALGYKEMIPVIKGETSLDDAIVLLKKKTRHFAKRQLTWFRRDSRINWYDVDAYEDCDAIASDIYSRLKEDFLNE